MKSDFIQPVKSRWSVAEGFPPATLMRTGADIVSGSWHEK